jgi:hypothetical protein
MLIPPRDLSTRPVVFGTATLHHPYDCWLVLSPSSIDGGYAVMFGDNSPISLINPAERRMESAKL